MESSLDKEQLQYSQPLVGKIGTFVIQQDVNKVWVFCSLACIKLNTGKTGQENTPLETEQTRAAILFSKISTSCIG